MIKTVLFKKDFRCFSKGDKFEFRSGINLLVGDQGCGKSTLIELIRSKLEPNLGANDTDSSYRAKSIISNHKIDELVEIITDHNTKCFAYDFERESARDMSAIHFDMVAEQLAAMKSSHGQGNHISLNRSLGKISKSKDIGVVLLDEPDAAMSPRSCYNLLLVIKAIAEEWKKQIILSAHNPIIINGHHPLLKKDLQSIFTEVLSLEDKKWMRSAEFMLYQLLDKSHTEKSRHSDASNEKEKKKK